MPGPAIGLIPLDDRPCNRVFPAQLADVAGSELHAPPRELLGGQSRPGDCEALAQWLRGCPATHLIVSLDMLCYGGLVASRTSVVSTDTAVRRLGLLRSVRQARPELSIAAFSTVTRLGTTVTSAADLETHALLRSYSQLVDRAERLGDHGARAQLNAVLDKLEPSKLADYLAVRRRNHAINRAAIELVAEGVIDYLVLAQEDAAPVGIHIPEQIALRGQAEEYRVEGRVAVRPGADEVGLVLLARHCALAAGRTPRMAVDYATGDGADVVPLFEDQPLRRTLEAQVRDAAAHLVAPGEAEAVLLVHTPIGPQTDVLQYEEPDQAAARALQAENLARRVTSLRDSESLLGVADVAHCNGGDPTLVAALRRAGALGGLTAYAGWNTTANALGTAVSHLCLVALAGPASSAASQRASRRFLASRLIDDYAYQSCIRRQATELAAAEGLNPHSLGVAAAKFRDDIEARLQPVAREICADLFGQPESLRCQSVTVSLPWERLFEVEVALDLSPASADH